MEGGGMMDEMCGRKSLLTYNAVTGIICFVDLGE